MTPQSEIFLVFAMVEMAIWMGNLSKTLSWLLGALALFGVLRHWWIDSRDLKSVFIPVKCARIVYCEMYMAFFACGTAILVIAGLGNPAAFALPDLARRFAVSVLFYLGNALWQQILLNGYFYPRLNQAFCGNQEKAIIAVGALFALVHLPNPVLVPVTMLGGMLSAYFFQKTRNIYVLVIAHAILAVAVMYLLPESWHHHLRIGPGYFLWGR